MQGATIARACLGPALGAASICALLWHQTVQQRSLESPARTTIVRRAVTTTQLPIPMALEPHGNAALAEAERGPIENVTPRLSAPPTLPDLPPEPVARAAIEPPRPRTTDDRQWRSESLEVSFNAQPIGFEVAPDDHADRDSSDAQFDGAAEQSRRLLTLDGSPWPDVASLWTLCEPLKTDASAGAWVAQVYEATDRLRTCPKLSDPAATELLRQLVELGVHGEQAAEAVEPHALRRDWLRAAYALQRRAKVWQSVNQALHDQGEWLIRFAPTNHSADLRLEIDALQTSLSQTVEGRVWSEYLLLNDLADVAAAGKPEQQQQQAQRCLMRFDWSGLTPEQRRFLAAPELQRLRLGLLRWATDAVDYEKLLVNLERQENDPLSLESQRLATTILALRYGAGETVPVVSEMMDEQYRNANLRLAIHKELLNRLIPSPQPRVAPVRQTILGAQVRGMSRTEADLKLQLVPHDAAWQVKLNIDGQVSSRTRSRSGPAELLSNGTAAFTADRLLRLDQDGATTRPHGLVVDSHNKIRELRTDYDGLPLLGDLVREVAWMRYEQQRGEAKAETEAMISAEVQRSIDAELGNQLKTAEQQFSQQLLGPLTRLQLDPQVLDLQTTSNRLVARYRLASPWQLASTTPRPRAPNSSWLSVQLHQSAINNAFAGMGLSERVLTLPELVRKLLDTFEQQAVAVPEDVPEDVRVQFAPTRPITVEIDDDRLWLTLRVVRLTQPGRIDLRYFVIRAPYQPQVDGLDARLIREGTLQISGPRLSMGDRLALRTIFNKVLARDREMPLVSQRLTQHPVAEELEVGQFEMRDGWLAIALQPRGASQVLRSQAVGRGESCPPESRQQASGEVHPRGEDSGG